MNIMLRHIIVLLLLISSATLSAQVSVDQTVDSVGIFIGEQAHLTLRVTCPKGFRLSWPNLKERQYLTPGIEIVEVSKPDTTDDGSSLKVQRVYTITSFNERLYAIPALTVRINGKPYKGANQALKVITINVDTLHPNRFYGPKDVQDNPFKWSEWEPWFWLAIVVVLLGVVFLYLYIRLKEHKPIITRIHIVRHIPPHERALKAIDKIKTEHLQASTDQKAYYTQLTDTLRKYIEERFGFNAMEMTSAEILEHLQQAGDRKMLDELSDLFRTADLVKFAKYSTLLNENDANLVNAVNFIDSTKQEGQEVEEKIVPKLSEDDRRSRTNRITIKGLLWFICIIGAALLAFVIYNIYLLMI